MPPKYNRRFRPRRRYRRKPYNNRMVRRPRWTTRTYVPTAFPSSKLVRFKYCSQISLNPVSSTITYHDFAANGLFDPDRTGVGHQPYGFDQWMVAYDHYMVLGSKIEARFTPTEIATIVPGYLNIGLFDTVNQPLSYSSIEHMLESDRVQKPIIAGFGNRSTPNSPVASVVKTFSHKKFFKAPITESKYQGTTTANPAEDAVFSVMVSSISANDPAPIPVLVTIEYIALLTEPRLLGQS